MAKEIEVTDDSKTAEHIHKAVAEMLAIFERGSGLSTHERSHEVRLHTQSTTITLVSYPNTGGSHCSLEAALNATKYLANQIADSIHAALLKARAKRVEPQPAQDADWFLVKDAINSIRSFTKAGWANDAFDAYERLRAHSENQAAQIASMREALEIIGRTHEGLCCDMAGFTIETAEKALSSTEPKGA